MTNRQTFKHYKKHFLRIAPVENALITILTLARALIPTAMIVYTAKFIEVALAVAGKEMTSAHLTRILAQLLGLLLIQFAVGELIKWRGLIRDKKVRAHVQLALLDKRQSLSYEHVDSEAFWQEMAIVEKEPELKLQRFFNQSLTMLELTVRIVGFTWILSQYIWWLGFLVVAMSLLMFKLSRRLGEFDYEAFEEAETYYHRASYFESVLSSKEASEERTLFQYHPYVHRLWDNWYEKGVVANNRALKKLMVKMSATHVVSKSIAVVIGLLLLIPLNRAHMTPGVYMSLLGNAFFLVDYISRDMVQVLKTLAGDNRFIRRYLSYLETAPGPTLQISGVAGPSHKASKLVVFDRVSFRYPGSDTYTIKDLSFEFEYGRRYALVGENGAGKSTLVKLMLGLYPSYEGAIYVGGVDLKKCSREALSAFYSVAFQDFSPYEIGIDAFLRLGNPALKPEDDAALWNCLEQMDLREKIEALPKGLKTSLGKLTDSSVTLSGGQLQKLVIGRTLLKSAPFTILDEPTAAIDPIQERALYRLFMQTEAGKTALIITHRLGAAVTADEILVLKEGRLSECGCHADLLKKRSTYFDLYDAQRGWYNA